ncbi:hypothetical protein [Streptomyces sp. HGB0020]|uniref:hypothetical protein n=1 Tax=Streptomyces sp. HGB0020 TaxID=1078086 RepID=UPI00034ECF74|nr:hypothetical protein [Streptomyces sp. HGB0020]EPD63139.1 hypothetical protein HMPREF1211_03480 [Streptomyces sp. HGB0020]
MTNEPPELDLWEITDSRRIVLGKRWKDVLAETGLSHETLNRWRKGYKVDTLTDRAFERALRWEQGARDAAKAGRQPTELDEAEVGADRGAALKASEAAAASTLPSRDVELLADLAAATANRLGLTAAQAEEAFRRALGDIEAKRAAQERGQEPPDVPRRVG